VCAVDAFFGVVSVPRARDASIFLRGGKRRDLTAACACVKRVVWCFACGVVFFRCRVREEGGVLVSERDALLKQSDLEKTTKGRRAVYIIYLNTAPVASLENRAPLALKTAGFFGRAHTGPAEQEEGAEDGGRGRGVRGVWDVR
jgi:hypothetical protein